MNEREKIILFEIIRQYINTGEPVSSRSLSKNDNILFSSATVRNIMADLAEQDFIIQPHTSAGRIPTTKAYRVYVNDLKPTHNNKKLPDCLEAQFLNIPQSIEEKLQGIIHLISSLSNFVGIVTSPKPSTSRMECIQFIQINQFQILVVLVTKTGIINNKIITIKQSVDQDFLNSISTYLNNRFSGQLVIEIKKKLFSAFLKKSKKYDDLLAKAIRLGKRAFDIDESSDLHLYGQFNVFEFSEEDKQGIQNFYQTIEQKTDIISLLNKGMKNNEVQVSIGEENDIEALDNYTVISKSYGTQHHSLGSVGMIGPTRMNYLKNIEIIRKSSELLSYELSKIISRSML